MSIVSYGNDTNRDTDVDTDKDRDKATDTESGNRHRHRYGYEHRIADVLLQDLYAAIVHVAPSGTAYDIPWRHSQRHFLTKAWTCRFLKSLNRHGD
jgi:hypothetical protein